MGTAITGHGDFGRCQTMQEHRCCARVWHLHPNTYFNTWANGNKWFALSYIENKIGMSEKRTSSETEQGERRASPHHICMQINTNGSERSAPQEQCY
ncbi:hypothetical protein EVAR_89778_1 [Eumeta japonica]|uniref:Uncharacterized protein n=1 Tax=Eumeta variegata TaxID=151549 RepID=A0A4C1XDQ7_EUMVA|nr:hypothetical protein EVAR_89778_1 [Eumeta japonica]